MKKQKEILVQDVGNEEDDRFTNFYVYRRDKISGTPLYFAPYFTKSSNQPEGISHLSKVLGQLDNYSVDDILNDKGVLRFPGGN